MANSYEQLDIEFIKRKAISGVVTFTLRTFFIQIYTFFATFVLTILLSPEVFGVYFIVLALINILVYFSDVGLAAALIQKKEEPKRIDLITTFTIQQSIVLFLVAIGLIFSGRIANFYNLSVDGLLLLRMLIFSLLLSSLKTIPSILLERHLKFTRFVIPQIVENFVFYTLAIILALNGFGISSITWSIFARGLIGLILIYILSPFKPDIGFNIKSAKRLVSFGIPFQLNSIIALIKDDLLIVVIGKILPIIQIGYIGWSQRFAFLPLRFIMDNVIKVTFPAYSRLQNDLNYMKSAIEKSLFFVTFIIYPLISGLVVIAPMVIKIVPNYSKWEPALPLLYFFAINAIFAAVNTTLTNTLFALGKPSIILKLMMLWTILTWVLTFFFIKLFGFAGVAIASAMVSISTSIIIYFVNKEIKISITRNIYGPIVASGVMFFSLKIIEQNLPVNIFSLIFIIMIGMIIYIILSFLILREKLTESLKIVLSVIFPMK
ncbi:hypothetical protein A3A48_00675 [Candidatus Curtissbacteria bacterium RIFCSPLOWO2_01_FULL_37_9]|uniref:Uncharacterized protein n=1 Tax=Candidatus Curtissbacteria bacterium RIFCSPLOWO2_01_FULL_37_9 TaxID=1797724 RepID=A0A1F5GVL0_9BACT|nr:MAG: hypothetical protein A3A48_00675 [Candidatus Curtissbacteria bacterium RIFCSPLOWO2_01_FULL_37_9]